MQSASAKRLVASATRVRALTPTLAVLAALLAAGCQTQQPTAEALATNDYRLRHPIVVTEGVKTLDLPVGSDMRRLSPQLSAVVTSFAAEARSRGGGAMEIIVPSGAYNEAAVHAVLPQIRKALVQGGVSPKRIATRGYPVQDPGISAPVRLAYSGLQAKTGPCGQWPDNITGGGDGMRHNPHLNNTQYYNFGCAAQSNLAAMVDNPTDLLYPRASTPADQLRRGTVYGKYRAGEQTATDYKEGDGSRVSDATN